MARTTHIGGVLGTPTRIDRIRSQADDALAELTAARKQALSEYDADIRRIRDLQSKLRDRHLHEQPELFSLDAVLTPELRDLLESPLARYSG